MSTPPLGTLAERLHRVISTQGPISLVAYMGEANARYYASRDPLGATGDFTTAPEISQMFGEMVGVWLADLWQRAGAPAGVHYVEMGPGRGTLARDALRVAARFGFTPQVHFVETSPALRAVQAQACPTAQWHDDTATLPEDGPLLIVANEFFDALPIRQLVKTPAGWRERLVGLAEGAFVPVAGSLPMDAAVPEPFRAAADGAIFESCPAAGAILGDLAGRLARQGGAALVIDYGYLAHQTGSTLQALKNHAHADPFTDPGEADLTALVDFAALAQVAAVHGAHVAGRTTQGAWLGAMGIGARAQSLAKAAPAHVEAIGAALHRLTHAGQMGELFKVMALVAPGWPLPAGV